MDLFCDLKSLFGWYFFVFQPGIYIGRWDLPKNALDLVNLGPQSTVCNLHHHIWSHHPVLDFHTQITRKYNTATSLSKFLFFAKCSMGHFLLYGNKWKKIHRRLANSSFLQQLPWFEAASPWEPPWLDPSPLVLSIHQPTQRPTIKPPVVSIVR